MAQLALTTRYIIIILRNNIQPFFHTIQFKSDGTIISPKLGYNYNGCYP